LTITYRYTGLPCLNYMRLSTGCIQVSHTFMGTTRGKILLGDRKDQIDTIIHIFPHTGFTAEHLARAKTEHPEADTVIASISRSPPDHKIVTTAAELGPNFLIGNSHTLEILENGLPLAATIQKLLPEAQVCIFRERVTSAPIAMAGNPMVREYADAMAEQFLVSRNGCAMCIYRCPTFGSRVSIAGKAGVAEVMGEKPDGTLGAMSGSCKLHKDSLAPRIREELNSCGV
jgi:hypothetical protein